MAPWNVLMKSGFPCCVCFFGGGKGVPGAVYRSIIASTKAAGFIPSQPLPTQP